MKACARRANLLKLYNKLIAVGRTVSSIKFVEEVTLRKQHSTSKDISVAISHYFSV